MKIKFLSIFLLSLFLFALPAEGNTISWDLIDNSGYQNCNEPKKWTYNMQKSVYYYLFEKKNFKEMKNFYNFIQDLDEKLYNKAGYCNPVVLAIRENRYDDYLPELYEAIPEAFLKGDRTDYDTTPPILVALYRNNLNCVKFFYEHNIPVEESECLTGSGDIGGSRFEFGYNMLTFAKEESKVEEYLISQGCEKEKAVFQIDYYVSSDCDFYEAPGYKSKCLGTLKQKTHFKAISATMYTRNGVQWVKIDNNKKEVWIPSNKIRYDSGI